MPFADVVSYKNFVHAIAGSTGSTVALTTFFPLDTARTRLQVDDNICHRTSLSTIREIAKTEGFFALYRGWAPVVTSLCCSNFVYFYVYSSLKALVLRDSKPGPLKDLSLAFVAGTVNVLVTTPLWVVNTRLKLQGAKIENQQRQKYNGILDGLYKIYQREGILALWSGTFPSIVLVSNPAIHFMVYENLKRYLLHQSKSSELSSLSYFIIGAIAKAIATTSTYPLQVIQARLRAGLYTGMDKWSSIVNLLKDIIQKNGIQGLYKGLEAKLLQTILMSALMFMTYEKIAHYVFHVLGVKK